MMHFSALTNNALCKATLAKPPCLRKFDVPHPPPRSGLIKAVVLLVIFPMFSHKFLKFTLNLQKMQKAEMFVNLGFYALARVRVIFPRL